MIYDNIDRGMYDLSSDKSGIRVGNESYAIQGSSKNESKKLGDGSKSAGGGGCC